MLKALDSLESITMTTDADLLWSPSHPEKAQASLFREQVNATQGTDLKTYEELQKWSCKNRGAFWNQVWDWEGIIGDKGDGPVSHNYAALLTAVRG